LSFILPSEYHAAKERNETFALSEDTVKILMIISAMINGFGSSITWVAQGEYLATCATDANKGLFNSIFWMIYMTNMFAGGLFASVIVD
jgi:MFS family permease